MQNLKKLINNRFVRLGVYILILLILYRVNITFSHYLRTFRSYPLNNFGISRLVEFNIVLEVISAGPFSPLTILPLIFLAALIIANIFTKSNMINIDFIACGLILYSLISLIVLGYHCMKYANEILIFQEKPSSVTQTAYEDISKVDNGVIFITSNENIDDVNHTTDLLNTLSKYDDIDVFHLYIEDENIKDDIFSNYDIDRLPAVIIIKDSEWLLSLDEYYSTWFNWIYYNFYDKYIYETF